MRYVTGLNGREYKWSFVYKEPSDNKSSLHLKVRAFLKQQYPYSQIHEEVPIPATALRFDFFLPYYDLAVEANGEQHSKYNPFFHAGFGQSKFQRAQSNDRDKMTFCELNNIRLVVLEFNESEETWKEKFNA